jgi:regulator of protease activity HflC (stomatin/prohibitin superfamily)
MTHHQSSTGTAAIVTTILMVIILGTVILIWPFKMISPGYVGVVVDLFGSDQGVEKKELGVGFHIVAPWKCIYEFPVFEQNDIWEGEEGFNFQTSEGMAIHADIGITFHLEPSSVPTIFQRYRRGMTEISHIFLRNFIRDAINKSASKFTVQDLYSTSKETFFVEVENHVRSDLKDMGIVISRIYLIGRFHFPNNVIAAINSAIEANQKAQQRENELRQSEAEAKKVVAQAEGEAQCILMKGKAEAEANHLLTSSLSPALLEWQRIQKWDGKLPHITGATTPMIKI